MILILKSIGFSFVSVLISPVLSLLIMAIFIPISLILKPIDFFLEKLPLKKIKFIFGHVIIAFSIGISNSFFLQYFKLSDFYIHIIPILYIVLVLPSKSDFTLCEICENDSGKYLTLLKFIERSTFIFYTLSFYLFLTIFKKML